MTSAKCWSPVRLQALSRVRSWQVTSTPGNTTRHHQVKEARREQRVKVEATERASHLQLSTSFFVIIFLFLSSVVWHSRDRILKLISFQPPWTQCVQFSILGKVHLFLAVTLFSFGALENKFFVMLGLKYSFATFAKS